MTSPTPILKPVLGLPAVVFYGVGQVYLLAAAAFGLLGLVSLLRRRIRASGRA